MFGAQDVVAEEKDKVVESYRSAFGESLSYVNPYWEVASRLYQLWRGERPSQLNGTFSKIMLNVGHAAVQDRIPKLYQTMFADGQLLSLEADNPAYEYWVDQAEAWLLDLYQDESKLNVLATIMPTFQGVCAMGTGYRMPCVKHVDVEGTWKPIITVRDIDFFQILPSPVGGLVNPMDRFSEEAVPYFFFVDWMTDEQIKAFEKYGPSKVGDKKFPGFVKSEVEKLFKEDPGGGNELEQKYMEIYNTVGGVSYDDTNSWRERMRHISGQSGRRRVVSWFKRDEWIMIAQDKFKIYHGPNPLKNGLLPLTKWSIRPDFKNWFGISPLEMIEDIVITWMMNFNYRMDHLIRIMFPTKWIRSDVMGNKPESYFYDRPYAVHQFPTSVKNIREAVYYDRAQETPAQSFIEEDRLKYVMQMIDAQPDYSKGMGGRGTLSNETASGILALIRQSEGPTAIESMLLEQAGLAQEARLLLTIADKHILKPQNVKMRTSRNGVRWQTVDPDALTDQFTVHTRGTRFMGNKEQEFQKLMALYPLWSQRPTIDQVELDKQVAAAANVLPNVDKLIMQDMNMNSAPGETGTPPQIGGAASPMDMRQQMRGVANRNQVNPETGAAEQSPARLAV